MYTNPETKEDINLRVYYDFSKMSNYDSGFIKTDENFSQCLEIIKELGFDSTPARINSGQFIGDSSNVTGHFVETYNSLGANFETCAVEIENSLSFEHGNSTIIFSQCKHQRGPEILFSSFNGADKGFEIGINSANKLFMQYKESHGPQMVTFNNIPDKKNIYAITIDEEISQVHMRRWNLALEEFESKIFNYDSCECFSSSGSKWYIGSGDYKGDEGINLQDSAYKYLGNIDRFMYFDGKMIDEDIENIIKSTYEVINYIPETSGSYVDQRPSNEFEKVVDYTVSGITGYVDVITGYEQRSSTYQYITGDTLTGIVNSGDYYYQYDSDYSSNNVYGKIETTGIYKEVLAESTIYDAITGFVTGLNSDSVSWSDEGFAPEPIYYHSGVSGKLYDVYRVTPLVGETKNYFSDFGYYEMSGVLPIVMPDGNIGYGPTSYTYLGARDDADDIMETHMGVNLFSVSNFGDIDVFSPFDGHDAISTSLDLDYDEEKIALYINGVAQAKGDMVLDNVKCNDPQTQSIVNGDYAVYSHDERSTPGLSKIYYDDYDLSLITSHPMIDIVKNKDFNNFYSTPGIYKFNTWSDDATTKNIKSFPTGNFKLFFNGKKLISGSMHDYEVRFDYGEGKHYIDILSSQIYNSSGYYHIEPEFYLDDDANDYSIRYNENASESDNYFDYNSAQPFVYASFVSYLNGIRMDPKSFVYHAAGVDLIEQGKAFILERPTKIVYNNTDSSPNTNQQTVELFEIPNYGDNWSIQDALTEAGLLMNSDGSTREQSPYEPKQRRSAGGWSQDRRKPPQQITEITYDDL